MDFFYFVHSGIRQHIEAENSSILLAKEFLRKQRLSLRHRQSALEASMQEYTSDLNRHQFSVSIDLFIG